MSTTNEPKAMIVLAHGSEELEAVSIIDVLRLAKFGVSIFTVEGNFRFLETDYVSCGMNVRIIPDKNLNNLNDSEICDYSVIIIPGGLKGVRTIEKSEQVLKLISNFYSSNRLVAAICAGPLVLKQSQIAKGARITCYPTFKEDLDTYYHVVSEDVLIDNNVITGKGPAFAVQFALAIVEALCDKQHAEIVANQLLLK